MGRRKKGARVLGPYPVGDGRWRVVCIKATGERADDFAATPEAAERLKLAYLAELVQPCETVQKAITAYREHQVAKGNKKKSYKETERRLRLFFDGHDGVSLDMVTPRLGAELYQRLQRLAADSHRNILAEAKTFLRWCQDRGWIDRHPLDRVEGIGRRRLHGKTQLRVDEARKLVVTAAGAADKGAIATLCALIIGLRASEIVGRNARDVDDGGRLLWIDDSKTEAGRRHVEVPEPLAGLLAALAGSWPNGTPRAPDEPLFGRRSKRGRVWRHCREWVEDAVSAACTAAGVPIVCPHGLRGTHASLARAAGASGHVVAATLGHESARQTEATYARPEATDAGDARALLRVLVGGRS